VAQSTGVPERQLRSDRRRYGARFARRPKREFQAPGNRTQTHYSSGRVAGLLLKPEALSKEQKQHLEGFLQFCPRGRQLRKLALQFRAMLRWRKAGQLGPWMKRAAAAGFSFLAQFARALRRDLDAVTLALTTKWSTGPLEGQINRLKMIKRQMYGRAGFELLRARVLPWLSHI